MNNTPRRGMYVEVYRREGVDCTNGGISAQHNTLLLVGKDVPEIFEAKVDTPVVTLEMFHGAPRVKPDGDGWFMFGGNFVYSSDSRFPSDQPIKIHDRQE